MQACVIAGVMATTGQADKAGAPADEAPPSCLSCIQWSRVAALAAPEIPGRLAWVGWELALQLTLADADAKHGPIQAW